MTTIEDYITLREAVQYVPGRPNPTSIWRWCRHGVRTRSGKVLYLKHFRARGRIWTTPKWIEDFLDSLAEAEIEALKEGEPPEPTEST